LDEPCHGPDVGPVVDDNEATAGIGGRIEGRQPARHRVPDHDRAVDRQRAEKVVHLGGDFVERDGRAGTLALRG
jgi:hypothetical protein